MSTMHCPACRHEFRLGFTSCPDCRVDLQSGPPPAGNATLSAEEAQARLAMVPAAAFTTLPMKEAISLRNQLLEQSVLTGLAPAGGGACDPSGCSTNFTVMVEARALPGLQQRYAAAFERYAEEQGMTLVNEPQNACICCGTPVSPRDQECPDCGIALL